MPDFIGQLDGIRGSVGTIQSAADRARHLAETMRDHLLPEIDQGAPCTSAVHTFLGLAAELAEEIVAEAENIACSELEIRIRLAPPVQATV